jgi:flagellar motor switch/type III secretory pathway protein FliN
LVDTLTAIKQKTGIMPKFHSFAGIKGDFKSFWRLYVNDDKDISYPLIIGGEQRIVDDLLKKLFAKSAYQKSASPLIPLKIVSVVRKMRLSQLKSLKIGEIIILLTKRHPINEPLVIISDKIVCHTTLDDMELHLTQDPRLLEDTEELKMTIDDDDIDAIPENQSEEFDDNPHDNDDDGHHSINTALNDLKVTVTFELNRMELSTQAISHLREGSVLNLQKQITEDIYLTVSGRTIAVGEVVQVGRNFGVLIKEIL